MTFDDAEPAAGEPEVVLETDRLLLRPWRIDEAVIQRELWSERDPRVPAHRRIDEDGRPTVEELEGRMRAGTRAYGLGMLAIELKASGDVIGYCGLLENPRGPSDEPDLGYELLRRAWGHGYATEASSAVVSWARARGYRRLWATVRDWNAPSRRVLAKLGFVETGRVEPDEVHGATLLVTRGL